MAIKHVYYTMGQAEKITSLPQSALRYWETVFDELNPQKSPGGNRQYSDFDIKVILLIKDLLYEKGFTIKGAQKQLSSMLKDPSTSRDETDNEETAKVGKAEVNVERTKQKESGELIEGIIRELKDIRRLIDES